MKLSCRTFLGAVAAAWTGICLLPGSSIAQEKTAADLLFVLDSSNSMWGQIDGTAKSQIAKQAFEGFLNELPETTRAGLMAYGHRRKADCGDVETLVPVSPLDRGRLLEGVQSIKPRGKTPITESLRQAAAALGASDRPGQLVLISDGVETCGGDPCALAKDLAASGIDFKAHVIGFDIASKADQAKIACIAHLTGGTYWNAADAVDLAAALKETAVIQPDPVTTQTVRLTAFDKETQKAISGSVSWFILKAETEEVASSGLIGGSVEVALEPGQYIVSAELENKTGGAVFTVETASLDQKVFLASELPSATVTTDSTEAQANSPIMVSFTGPQADADLLRIVTPDGQRLEQDLWVPANTGSEAQLVLPSEPGSYEIAYVWTEYTEKVLASAPIIVTEAKVNLVFPAESGAGTQLAVDWEGPGGAQDYIAIVPKDGGANDYDGRWEGVANGPKLILQAPKDPGGYEVIYVSGVDFAVLARQPLKVVESGASVISEAEVVASQRVTVAWTGPAGGDDWIGISRLEMAPDDYVTYERPSGDAVTLVAPIEPGKYELRYVLSAADGAKVLATQPLTVTAPEIVLEGPSEAVAGSTVEISAAGPANGANWIGFSEPTSDAWATAEGAWDVADNIVDGKITIPVPQTPGDYELRFVLSGADALVVAKHPVSVK